MCMKHKWHKEIKAWADGAEIEFRDVPQDEWKDCGKFGIGKPTWDEKKEYRIKQQPKEPQYLYVYKSIPDNYGNGTSEVKIATVKLNNKYYLGKIRLDNDND